MNPEETEPAESIEPPPWGDGRLVIRRPELPDSDIAAMSVITNDDQHAALKFSGTRPGSPTAAGRHPARRNRSGSRPESVISPNITAEVSHACRILRHLDERRPDTRRGLR
jgi:hypothetical protein